VTERKAIDSLLHTGRLTSSQVIQLQKTLNSREYYAFMSNPANGEIEITDVLSFENDKKVLFQRCLQWIAITYGTLIYSDPESGKIIAGGSLDLKTYDGTQTALGATKINEIQTPASYTMILTIKDKKIKYTITNITYTFTSLLYPENDITYPISAIYPLKTVNINLIRYLTVLYSSSDMFYSGLKSSLINYVNEAENDYKF
jgi:hypothetical protein